MATYARLFEGLSVENKIDLIGQLSKSIKKEKKNREKAFYNAFGAFASNQSPEKIIKEIRANRKFRTKDISL